MYLQLSEEVQGLATSSPYPIFKKRKCQVRKYAHVQSLESLPFSLSRNFGDQINMVIEKYSMYTLILLAIRLTVASVSRKLKAVLVEG